jgi:NTP pyrophosphatase (non-canonical NTP hydrolase)
MNETEKKVLEWANKRGLIEGTTPDKQCIKLMEEVGELANALLKNKRPEILDSIGDIMVVLCNLSSKLDTSLGECFSLAYNEIKDRTGKMLNGTYVKEG